MDTIIRIHFGRLEIIFTKIPQEQIDELIINLKEKNTLLALLKLHDNKFGYLSEDWQQETNYAIDNAEYWIELTHHSIADKTLTPKQRYDTVKPYLDKNNVFRQLAKM